MNNCDKCGEELPFTKTDCYSLEKQACPKCGKLHKVDRNPIDWDKVIKASK